MRCTRAALFGLLGTALVALGGCGGGTPALDSHPTSPVTSPYVPYSNAIQTALKTAYSSVHIALPTRRGAPAPTLPTDAFGSGLGSHVVLGFLPSWELSDVGNLQYGALSEVAYYALQVEPHGTIDESGPGWDGLQSSSIGTLVSDAHAARTRALLTLFTETPHTINQLSRDPTSSGDGLADRVAQLLAAHDFDGVDIDIEGAEAIDRHGFTSFIEAFSKRLRTLDSTWTIVVNTYPQAAVDPESLYDVKAIAPYVDQLFVMAYDMSDLEIPGSASPLTGAELSDASSIASYVTSVPPSKVVLGIPFYGYDFQASRSRPPSVTVGKPFAVTYDEVVQAGRPVRWDPQTQAPYTSFKVGSAWHETWFEDPVSVALKVALAAAFKTAGVGAWELSMAATQPQMILTLDGGSAPTHLGLATQPTG